MISDLDAIRPERGAPLREAGPVATLAQTEKPKASDPAWKAAKAFEGLFLGQLFKAMFTGVKSDGLFGGGQAEQMWRGVLLEKIGDEVSSQSGLGIADMLYKDIAAQYRTSGQAAAEDKGEISHEA